MANLKIGKHVLLRGQGDGKYTVAAVEKHGGMTFYRLAKITGGLFLRGSLITTSRGATSAPKVDATKEGE